MEQYVENARLKYWLTVINAANNSSMTRAQYLKENNIARATFYYWYNKVRKELAEQNGLIAAEKEKSHNCLVEVPIETSREMSVVSESSPAAVISFNNITIIVSPEASGEFMENLGRMIKNAM